MKRFRMVGLCLMAAVASSAIAVSAASAALPEFLGTPSFTSHGGEVVLKVSTSKIKCASASGTGLITGAKAGTMSVTASGCKLSGVDPCNSPGAGEEEMTTATLDMTLGYITKSTKDVGVDLTGTGGAESNLLAEAECKVGETCSPVKIKGSIIGLLTPVDTSALTFTLHFTESGGKQAVEKFEGKAKDTLEVSLNHGVFEEGVEIAEDAILTATDLKIDA